MGKTQVGEVKTDKEMETRLFQIQELKARLAWKRSMPEDCGSKCAIVCYETVPGIYGQFTCRYVADTGKRVATATGKRFKAGQTHPQCADCKIREKNESKIRGLKWDLGLK